MKNIAVIYWSGTGNTEAMAQAIVDGIKASGANAELYQVSQITVEKALAFDALALGCPSMGAEVLEEVEFEPFFTELEGQLGGKKVALFGSYGWGDGEWMRDWQVRTDKAGATVFEEGFMLNETPDAAGIEESKAFGKRFAAF